MDKKSDDILQYAYYSSPVGWLRIGVGDQLIKELGFHNETDQPAQQKQNLSALHILCIEQLIQYFQGERRHFELPIQFEGSPFQQQVWNELLAIPFGKTISYGQLAVRVGDANASRAVAQANNRNPIAIVIPCHRVIGSKGELTGYGGGIWRKKWLLDHERKYFYGVQTLF